MRVGLGTGSTVAHLLGALGERELREVSCVATSPATERAARALGLTVRELDEVGELDVAIDGADQIDPSGWLVKGGGGAHTREKIVAAAARRFVVIASAEKAVRGAGAAGAAGADALRRAEHAEDARPCTAARRGGEPGRRPDRRLSRSGRGPAGAVGARLGATPGVVEHGLFAPEMVSVILIAGENGVERRAGAKQGT